MKVGQGVLCEGERLRGSGPVSGEESGMLGEFCGSQKLFLGKSGLF